MKKLLTALYLSLITSLIGYSQALDFTSIRASVDFSRTLQDWDGFGFNYVETAHSADMNEFRQEYGGFSLLDEIQEKFAYLGVYAINKRMLVFDAPAGRVTTFFAN